MDIFCIAHALGWFAKAMILRDYWFCWVRLSHRALRQKLTFDKILSISFELAEYSLQHQLPNFAEVRTYHTPIAPTNSV